MNDKALFKLSYGLFVLTAKDGDFDNGCIINTAIQVTNTPNKILMAVNKGNYTTEMISKTGKFNLSVISQKATFSLFEHFGFKSGRDTNKFADFCDFKRDANGISYITKGTNAYFACTVENVTDAGTHYVFIATLDNCEILSDDLSATYEYYFANIKPQPKKQVSTGEVWVCKICGYRYDNSVEAVKFQDLPNDWVCPLCKHPKSDFELE